MIVYNIHTTDVSPSFSMHKAMYMCERKKNSTVIIVKNTYTYMKMIRIWRINIME